MVKWRCTVCGYIYDEGTGDLAAGAPKGTLFEELPVDWVCPVCGAPKSAFVKLTEEFPELKEKVTTQKVEKATVADRILEQLWEVGVRHIYGIPGDSNLPLVESIRKQNKIKFILVRHEETAAFMASAHGKLTGKIGVCLSIAGPGTTNLITGLMDAAADGAPVLALTGQIVEPYLGSESFQEIDQIELFRTFTVFSECVAHPSQAIRLTILALKKAYSKRGVAHLSLPTDILAMPLVDTVWRPEVHIFRQSIIADEEEISAAVKLISESKRPVVFGGWGIRESGAAQELIELAEKISAPIATTSRAKGAVLESHRLAVGVLGSLGHPQTAKIVSQSDLILVVGSGFRQINLVPKVPIIQIDIDSVKVGKSFPVKVGLIGDAKMTLRRLIQNVAEKAPNDKFLGEIRKAKELQLQEAKQDSEDMSIPINPGFVVQAVKRHASRDALICVDVGDHTYWFFKRYLCEGEQTLMSACMASMAFALPAALSAQIDYPTRQVICVAGDGGFGMLMADFSTAVLYHLPIKVVVFNDGKIKNIKKEQKTLGYAEFSTDLVNPNFASFAETCGGAGFRVEEPQEIDDALRQAFRIEKPALVDVLIDPEKTIPILTRPPRS